MDFALSTVILSVTVCLFLLITQLLRKGRIPFKFYLLWLLVVIIMLGIVFFPFVLITFMKLIGFQTLTNFLIGVMFIILFAMLIALTVIVSGQKTKIQLLIQEVSLLKSQVNNKE